MIACVCRNISDKGFSNKEELINRLKEQDKCCGNCADEVIFSYMHDKTVNVNSKESDVEYYVW